MSWIISHAISAVKSETPHSSSRRRHAVCPGGVFVVGAVVA